MSCAASRRVVEFRSGAQDTRAHGRRAVQDDLRQPYADAVTDAWDQVRDQLAAGFPKAGPLMDTARAEVLAFAAFPRAHWQKTWSSNPLERINKEFERRSRVVGIFPNEASVIRLVGAILADFHDEWQASDRRYLPEDSMRLPCPSATASPQPNSQSATNHRGSTPNIHHATGHS